MRNEYIIFSNPNIDQVLPIYYKETTSIAPECHTQYNIGKYNYFISKKLNRFFLLPSNSFAFVSYLLLLCIMSLYLLTHFNNSSYTITLTILTIFFFIFTAIINPGIVPRTSEDHYNSTIYHQLNIDPNTNSPRPRFLTINGVSYRQKWCSTCRIYRPPRSHHCSCCDVCVYRFDHHCVFLGSCIGIQNYPFFLLLLIFLTLDALNAFISSITFFFSSTVSALFVLFTFLVALSNGLLLFYHLFISSHNLTTNEHLKQYFKLNPFDYGNLVNLKHIFCQPYTLLPERKEEASNKVSLLTNRRVDISYYQLGVGNSDCESDLYD